MYPFPKEKKNLEGKKRNAKMKRKKSGKARKRIRKREKEMLETGRKRIMENETIGLTKKNRKAGEPCSVC